MMRWLVIAAMGWCGLFGAAVRAEGPVRIVVPVTAGGGHDRLARALATSMAEALGQAVIVENRPGGNSAIGMEYVIRAAPDGRTMLLTAGSLSTGAALGLFRLDPRKELAPLIHVTRGEVFLAVNAALNVSSVADLQRLAVARPKGLNCGGITGTLGCEQLRVAVDGASVTVPYPGVQQAILAMITGQVDVVFLSRAALQPLLGTGRVNVLAVASDRPAAHPLDKIPLLTATWADMGMPTNAGLFLPAGTPESIVRSLNATINGILAGQAARAAIEEMGYSPVGGSPEAWGELLASDIRHYQALTLKLRLRPADGKL